MKIKDIPQNILESVRRGTVIPAMPLALDENRKMDVKRQRALVRYYIDAGVGGIAVAVHSTQFEIREPGIDLLQPVLHFVSKAIDEHCKKKGKSILKIAGVCGNTKQALEEAELAKREGYQACLLSLAAVSKASTQEQVVHCKKVSEVMPIVGFYLQPSVGGCILPYEFWRRFAEIENILAIKMAPFNRYQTIDVVRAICDAGRENEISLYTGNDDNIVMDLLSPYRFSTPSGVKTVRIVGGLLGHWCVWTKKAVELFEEIQMIREKSDVVPASMLTTALEVTDSNAAFFDPSHGFHGCISGLHEVLRRQGLFKGIWCLNPNEKLSPGQSEEIDRVYKAYPHLNDDEFVKAHLSEWLEG